MAMQMIAYWMGKPADELTREEAIDAVKIMSQEIEMMRKTFVKVREIDKMIADRRLNDARRYWWGWKNES
jgi:hypothetical protein